MLTTVWVAASTKRWLRACRASASRFCITSAVTPHASAAIANRPAASESQPTRTRCAGRRGGGLTGLRAGLAAFAGFDSVRAAALTVAAPWAGRLDSPSAGPAGRDALRRARRVVDCCPPATPVSAATTAASDRA
ncbi:exported hypothetical protein [Mycobacterium tuberculosis]|nr:exported hypothetical protein [Mycobacterium tuberculosis]